jgi:hypothetical protein
MGVLYLVLLSLITVPAVIGTIRGQFLVILAPKYAPYPIKVYIFLALILLLISAAGVYAYLMIFVGELYVQVTCVGVGCAQGGIGLLLFTPVSWISYAVTYGIARLIFNGKFLPVLTKPNF